MHNHLDRLVPVTGEEIQHARHRPPHERITPPRPGDRVYYRHDQWGGVVDAVVVKVQHPELADTDWGDPRHDGCMWVLRDNVPIPARGIDPADVPAGWLELRDDPWPLVRLRTTVTVADPFGRVRPREDVLVDTREARVRGSSGWLPLDWVDRPRPAPAAAHQLQQLLTAPAGPRLPGGGA